jgi:hypothetical protein
MDRQRLSRRGLLFGAGIAIANGAWAAGAGIAEAPIVTLRPLVRARTFNGVRLVAVGTSGWETVVGYLAYPDGYDIFIAETAPASAGACHRVVVAEGARPFEAMGVHGAVTLIVGETVGQYGSAVACAVAQAASRCGHLTAVLAAPPSNWRMQDASVRAAGERLSAVADCVMINPRAGKFESAELRAAELAKSSDALMLELLPEKGVAGFRRLARVLGRAGFTDHRQFMFHASGPVTTAGLDYFLANIYGKEAPPARRMLIHLEGEAPFDAQTAARMVALIEDCLPNGDVCEWSFLEHPTSPEAEYRRAWISVIRTGVAFGDVSSG